MAFTIPRTEQQLRSAARGFLMERQDCVALAPHYHQVFGLIEQFADGGINASGLRAAFGSAAPIASVPKAKSIAVLYLTGILTPTRSFLTEIGLGTSVHEFRRQVQEAGADPGVASIFVVIDTPGGYTGMLPETAAVLRSVRQVKPIVGSVLSLNASAGYWLTANCTVLEATQSALVGSIGVFGIRASHVRQLDKEGIDVEVFSAGKFKTEGLPVTAVTEDERRASNARVNETYTDFINDVAAGRRVSGAGVRAGFGEGRAVSAKEALRLGMIDRVATLEESIGRLVTATSARNLNATYPIAVTEDDRLRARLYGCLPTAKRYAVDDRNAADERERYERMYRY